MGLFFKAFKWTFLLGGLLAFAAAAYLTAYLLSASGRAVTTDGVITRVTEVTQGLGSNRRTGYVPSVRFAAADGTVTEFEGHYSKVNAASAGERVPVLYDPRHPRWAVVYESAWSVWFWPAMLYAMAAVFAAAGLLFSAVGRRFPAARPRGRRRAAAAPR